MPIDQSFASALLHRLNSVEDVKRTSNTKFRAVRDLIESELGRASVTSYLSKFGQFPARVGASLMGFADIIVLLSEESWTTTGRDGVPFVERLEQVVQYTSDLEAIIACVGSAGSWSVEFIAGRQDSDLRRELAAVFPDAQDRPVKPRPPARSQPPPPPPSLDRSMADLAEELYLPEQTLRDIEWLLRDKKALVFYGPPGTGKTYLAQRIARWLQPHAPLRRLVQMHPSYGYEEFFEGYRPVGESKGISLAKQDGPLRKLVRNALGWPGHPAVLVIDEMNRANLPRVFGELFYLLEYREESARLMYSPAEEFSLPEDFYVIGTMNTADRSVATLDQALRRRFHFFGLFPGEEPVTSMFRRFLADRHPEQAWLAGLLDRANEQLADRNLAIGPSHFMREQLDEVIARRVWAHSVLPTIRDQFFDDPGRAEAFDFDMLRDVSAP